MIGQRCALTATVVLLLLAPSLAMACEPTPIGKDAARIDGQNFVLVWRVEPAPLRLGEFFAVLVSACERARTARVQAESRRHHAGAQPRHELPADYHR